MTTMFLMVGNIGTGKSTIAKKLSKIGAVVVNNDTITTMVNGYEYGAYDIKKKSIYRAIEITAIKESLKSGFDVVVDRTNVKPSDRAAYIAMAKEYGARVVCYNFGKGSSQSLKRRIESNNGICDKVWEMVHENFMRSYEKPELSEGIDEIITAPLKYTFHAFDFDGTLVSNKFPEIGDELPLCDTVRSLYKDVSNIVIIWTCRSGDYVRQMRKFLVDKNIPFDFINENPIVNYGSNKIFANYYYDDRNKEIS